jgi:arylsulfatase A-like enzyme
MTATLVGLLGLALFLGGCQFRGGTQPSVLVVMVGDLGFGAFSCGEGDVPKSSGFQVFCDEAVRFTHAYVPSVLGQPNVASLLTGRYPHEHGVRHNGPGYLPAREVTVFEVALDAGFRTSFFSGGPPVWRRGGFNQGVEAFDDSVPLQQGRLYRTASTIAGMFVNWLDGEAQRQRFFSFLFFPDPQFTDATTTNALGEVRESSYQSQIDEIDDALGFLAREMKKRKVWDSTDVILVGTGAAPSLSRLDEHPQMNLFSESTRTTLMIKPSRKTRDGPFNWKIDPNVSLVDVGVTLFDLIGKPKAKATSGAVSLRSALKGPEVEWPLDRMIVSESAWARWRGVGSLRGAVRQEQYLFLYDDPDRLFDTLTDNFEKTPLPFFESTSRRSRYSTYLRALGFEPWRAMDRFEVEKSALARELWRDKPLAAETMDRLRQLAKRYPDDQELRNWRALLALRQSDWTELKAVATKPLQATWAYVAARNLGEKVAVPDEVCLSFLKPGEKGRLPKTCSSEGIRELLAWADESASEKEKTRAQEVFWRLYSAKLTAMRIAESNYVAAMPWDTSIRVLTPDSLELILALPEMKKQRQALRARAGQRP